MVCPITYGDHKYTYSQPNYSLEQKTVPLTTFKNSATTLLGATLPHANELSKFFHLNTQW